LGLRHKLVDEPVNRAHVPHLLQDAGRLQLLPKHERGLARVANESRRREPSKRQGDVRDERALPRARIASQRHERVAVFEFLNQEAHRLVLVVGQGEVTHFSTPTTNEMIPIKAPSGVLEKCESPGSSSQSPMNSSCSGTTLYTRPCRK